jgi:hypothetical protein
MVSKYNVATMCYGSAADNCHEKEQPGDRDALGLNGELMKKSSRGSEMHDQTDHCQRTTGCNDLELINVSLSVVEKSLLYDVFFFHCMSMQFWDT